MASTVLGSLLVSLGIDSAEFDKGLDNSGKTAQRFSRDVSKLKADIDPAWAAMQKLEAEARVVSRALSEGAISANQAGLRMREAGERYRLAAAGMTQANGAARAGFQQLGFQISDAATQFAGGTRAALIFAQQGPQVVQAITLMGNEASGFAKFMGGPWGAAIMVGVAILGALITKLGETSDAMEDVKFASNAVGDAQSILGNVMDLTTGKINTQNKALLALAQAQLLVARIQSQVRAADARRTLNDIASPRTELSGGLGGGFAIAPRRDFDVDQKIVQQVLNGKVDAQTALRNLETMRAGKHITDAQFTQAASTIANLGVETANQKVYDDALKALNGGGLSSELRRPGPKGSTPKTKTTPDMSPQQAEKIAALEADEVQARLALVTDAGERLDIQKDLLMSERAQKVAQVEAEKNFTREQKDAQIAILNRIYGQPGQTDAEGNIVSAARPGLLSQKLQQDYERRLEELQIDELQKHQSTLEAQAELETNTRKRSDIEARILAIQQEVEKRKLEEQIAAGDVADATRARADLEQRQAAQREQLRRASFTPGQRYVFDLQNQASNINDGFEQAAVDGLEAFNNGLVDAIVNFKSLGAVAQSVLKTVLGDLLNLEIRKGITLPLANALGLGKGVNVGKDIGGNTKGLESNFDKVFGGGASDAGLSAAGTSLSASATQLTAAATQLQTAAASLGTHMSAPTVSGGGGILKGILGVASLVAGSTNFSGKAISGAKAVGSSVVGGANAARKLKFFADGTPFSPRGLAIVGEEGPEAIDLPMGAQVHSNDELRSMMGGRTEIHRPTFNFPGITNPRDAREAAGQAARRYRQELTPMRGM